MTYNKLVNGELVPMTPEEITDRQTEEQAWIDGVAAREAARLEDLKPKVPDSEGNLWKLNISEGGNITTEKIE